MFVLEWFEDKLIWNSYWKLKIYLPANIRHWALSRVRSQSRDERQNWGGSELNDIEYWTSKIMLIIWAHSWQCCNMEQGHQFWVLCSLVAKWGTGERPVIKSVQPALLLFNIYKLAGCVWWWLEGRYLSNSTNSQLWDWPGPGPDPPWSRAEGSM